MTRGMTATTAGMMTAMTEARRRPEFSVRARITASVAVLVLLALGSAGLIVYAVERDQLDDRNIAEVEQELDEFAILHRDGAGSDRPFTSVTELLQVFLERNVPDTDELLVGWVGGEPVVQSLPGDDRLLSHEEFVGITERLVASGGSERFDSIRGDTLVTAQPVHQGDDRGALVVVTFLDLERAELRGTMRTYAVVAAIALLLIGAFAAWLSGRLLAPLRTLRAAADEIGATDLSRRIPLSGNDDITALTRTVNGMLDRLEAAFVAQRRFLDDAGHELRTPLTIVRGHLELLDPADPAEVAATRDLLLDETDRMARLVGDLILLAKSDRPDFLTPGPVDVTGLTWDVLAKARALGDRRWEVEATADVEVVADEQRLTQALLQLCDNAVKHTGPGDTVALGSAYADGRLRLWVRDSGPGIPLEQQTQVFTRFVRGEETTDDEGFGLGLSIVSAIAEAHGGSAAVEGGPPGALVALTLPVTARPAPAPEQAEPNGPNEPTEETAPWPAS